MLVRKCNNFFYLLRHLFWQTRKNYDCVSLPCTDICTVILFSMGKCILDVPLKGEIALVAFFWAIRHCLISRADDWQVVSVLKSRRLQLSWKLVEAVVHVLLLWAGKSKINVGNSWLTAIDVSYCLFQPPLSLFCFFPLYMSVCKLYENESAITWASQQVWAPSTG